VPETPGGGLSMGPWKSLKAVCSSFLRSRRPVAWAIVGPRSRAGGDPFALLDRHRAERSVSQGFPSARRNGASLTDAPALLKAAEMRAKGGRAKGGGVRAG